MKPVNLRRIAAAWRNKSREHSDGVVLIYDGQAYGWKNTLRDPCRERPGAYAVEADGSVFIATGGDPQNGAKRWERT